MALRDPYARVTGMNIARVIWRVPSQRCTSNVSLAPVIHSVSIGSGSSRLREMAIVAGVSRRPGSPGYVSAVTASGEIVTTRYADINAIVGGIGVRF